MSRIAEALCPRIYEGVMEYEDKVPDEEKRELNKSAPNVVTVINAKAEYTPKVHISRKPLTMQQYAQYLKREYPGLDVGRQRLFKWFRREGVMGSHSRTPDWAYIRDGLFIVKRVKTTSPNVFEPVMLISPQGQLMFTAAIVRALSNSEKQLA